MSKKKVAQPAELSRGYVATKLGLRSDVRYALVKIDDDVWDAFGGDKAGIEAALASAVSALARLVLFAKAAKRARKQRATAGRLRPRKAVKRTERSSS